MATATAGLLKATGTATTTCCRCCCCFNPNSELVCRGVETCRANIETASFVAGRRRLGPPAARRQLARLLSVNLVVGVVAIAIAAATTVVVVVVGRRHLTSRLIIKTNPELHAGERANVAPPPPLPGREIEQRIQFEINHFHREAAPARWLTPPIGRAPLLSVLQIGFFSRLRFPLRVVRTSRRRGRASFAADLYPKPSFLFLHLGV
jgi:hypothetical protein